MLQDAQGQPGAPGRDAWQIWGGVHAAGELAYLASQNLLDLIFVFLDKGKGNWMDGRSDNLTFIFGFLLFVLLLFHTVYGFFRHRACLAANFRRVHAGSAVVVLLVATAHWWPFVIFLTPAVACAAAAQTVRVSSSPGVNSQIAALALGTSIIGAVMGIVPVWAVRQIWVLNHPQAYYALLVHMFPVAGVFCGFCLARVLSAGALRLSQCKRTSNHLRVALLQQAT